jgi:ABC-2 type transport system permease protein
MRVLARMAWLELKLLVREPITVVFVLAMPLVMLFVLGEVFGSTPEPEGNVWRGQSPIQFYVPAYVGLVMCAIGVLTLPVHLSAYRERGVLRRLRASSIPAWTLAGAQVLVTVVIAAVSGVIVYVAASARYDISAPASLGGTLLGFTLSALSFASLGVLLGSLFPSARAAQGVGILLFFVMLLLGGAGPPREVMTAAMRSIGDALPLTHVVDVLQGPWLGLGWDVASTAVVAAILVVSSIGAVLLLRRR